MKEISETLKGKLGNYISSIELIVGLTTLLIGLSTLFSKILESKYNIAIILLAFFFIIRTTVKQIIKKPIDSDTAKTRTKTLRILKFVKYGSYLFLVFPIFLVVSFFIPKKGKDCSQNKTKFGLLITNFSKSDDDDDFSYKVFSLLDAELQNNDSIIPKRLTKYVNTATTNYKDTILNLFQDDCFNHGILAFGKRSLESKLFDCNIYINNLTRLNYNLSQVKSNIIYIQNPNLINFSLDYQAETIAEFILGLLYYNSNSSEISKQKFIHSLNLSQKEGNTKFKSYCHLFIGNNAFDESQYEVAVNEYKNGIIQDSLSSYLHYNLGLALLKLKDSISANKEFKIASILNKNMPNPIRLNSVLDAVTNSKQKIIENKESVDSIIPPKSSIKNPTTVQKIQTKLIWKNGVAIVSNISNKFGVINLKGDTVIRCIYESIQDFPYKDKYYFFIVQSNSKFGALSVKGGTQIPINRPNAESVKTAIINIIELNDNPNLNIQF